MAQKVSLNDKYSFAVDRAYMTGIEALVRLPLVQHQRDIAAGLNTAGFVSGYRGSPVGTLDQSIWKAGAYFEQHNIQFQPGVNEDLAATAVWGSQQVHLIPKPKYDGIFAMWYGKGPGVDRSMDVIKHANAFGTTKYGGVLAVAGDDHACKSSTVPHQSEHMFIGATVPVLNPANVQEVLDFGLYGWALSRFSGCWVGLKAITENMDSAMSVELRDERVQIVLPKDIDLPLGGLNAQWPTTPLQQEALLQQHRIYAARAFALSNNLNTVMLDSESPRLGIVTSGKTYLDVMEAMNDLGISRQLASEIGVRILKVGMSWPLEPVAIHQFARGLSEILVVEEKRSIVENQLTSQLYNWPVKDRPLVVGEYDENGHSLITNLGELTPAVIAGAIASRINQFYESKSINQRLEFIQAKQDRIKANPTNLTRTPYFCSGCPHNISTKIPEGSTAMAGIGCHYMVKWMDRNTETFTHMGGEGAAWIGQSAFSETEHVFQNMGDGTYFHSGILAIRAAVAAGVNITYKVLFNDAVAMTGGQPVEGSLSLFDLVSQVRAEGVKKLSVVSEHLAHAKKSLGNFSDVTIHSRKHYEKLQRDFRKIKGTTVIVYDQVCAAEKRRRRKRGLMPKSKVRVYINEQVCEGCGDCSTQSNCLSVLPKVTETDVKRQIDQHACNQDLSCVDGFCPSFVTVTGASLNKQQFSGKQQWDEPLPEPKPATLERPWNVLVTGIGGTGVLTIGSILAMAAHIEGKGCSTLNQTGLAQKFGAVVSHVRVAQHQQQINAVRISEGDADLLLGCDLVVSAMPEAIARLNIERSHSIVNSYQNPTADFILDKDYTFPAREMQQLIGDETGVDKTKFIDATKIARNMIGDSISSNMLLLGFAYQNGLIPVQSTSISAAIRLNNVAVDLNEQAFLLGRRAAVDYEAIESLVSDLDPVVAPLEHLDEIIRWRADYLTDYQDIEYSKRYLGLITEIKNLESALKGSGKDSSALPNQTTEFEFTKNAAKSLFKLMAYKDEYEIARLYSGREFWDGLNRQFEGNWKLNFYMAPPMISKKDALTGRLIKRCLPGFLIKIFPLIAKLKVLRGSVFDPFGKTRERKIERQLINQFSADIRKVASHFSQKHLSEKHYQLCIQFAAAPMKIKGFGHIKTSNIDLYRQTRKTVLQQLDC
ncbi:indolepyruvate ferredoxin oxidoreductase family protein [Candidatus Spongiihabitans sp.]|uniref:indolepyruvate ferredoxin oxidoreductase family protein n=1 Tax=Candidatus Spongiihabitans sp. TaxID=3101308 RepID=UPI003C6F6E40